jgi:hypothetical protein
MSFEQMVQTLLTQKEEEKKEVIYETTSSMAANGDCKNWAY